ncbi:hypothetical protein M413DRAFT_13420 [Hebeloma cylindrosporum]|uniref:Hydrophobin n=1 Tax=Hebeloma cylindrosporum TaxID=76867 RepID=A0A0C3BZP1_HEBCY|nr:hypothetical protein M413DRAFT_13420 [Hebeloma cylindrosporum h7]
MFSKVALFVTAAFAASAMATPVIYGSCKSGPVQCCGSLHAPGSTGANNVLADLVGVVVGSISAQVGAHCNPITAAGAGTGANCASSPVCCEQNFFSQFVGVNCSPATVGA